MNPKNKSVKAALAAIIFAVFAMGAAQAAGQRLINYQGRLTDKNGKPLEGAYNITFGIYNAETAGERLWAESHNNLVVQKGVVQVLLGSVEAIGLTFDSPYWLEVKVNDQVLSPRQAFSSVGYAYNAEFADNDLPKGTIIMWSGSVSYIPAGWVLCNGSNGAPDLRDRFVAGAGGSFAQTGGAAEALLTMAEMPAHRHYSEHKHSIGAHTHTIGAHQHTQTKHKHPIGCEGFNGHSAGYAALRWRDTLSNENFIGSGGGGVLTEAAGGGDTSSVSIEFSSYGDHYTLLEGSGKPQSNLPPYYALAYIMKL